MWYLWFSLEAFIPPIAKDIYGGNIGVLITRLSILAMHVL
jgi:hypothetical protein